MEIGNRGKGKWIKENYGGKKAVDIAIGTLPEPCRHHPEAQASDCLRIAAPHFDKRIPAAHQR